MSEENQMDGDGEDERILYCRTFEKILQKREKGIQIEDVDVQAGCPPGENFAADVLRVVVYGRRLCLGAWSDFRKNFIVKRVPDSCSPYHKFYNCVRMFQNELTAYEEILPMCQNYLDKKSRNEIDDLSFPKFYGQSQQFLVLEDLQTEGYQLVNRVKGFSKRECSLILEELSKFHAVSFALKKDEKALFFKNVDKLKETVFREEHKDGLTGAFWENSLKFAMRSLNESKNARFQKAADTLKFFSGQILTSLIDLIQPEFSKFEVVCHGDLWSNNIMLRYCDSGYPIGVKFIDLQGMRYSSCVLDVMHVLFTSSRPAIYETYFQVLLSEYYDYLVFFLKQFDAVPNFTFEEFLAEFKRKITFGIFLACLMFTWVTKTSQPEPSDSDLINEDATSESQLEKTYLSLGRSYHERLHALFFALTNSNFI